MSQPSIFPLRSSDQIVCLLWLNRSADFVSQFPSSVNIRFLLLLLTRVNILFSFMVFEDNKKSEVNERGGV